MSGMKLMLVATFVIAAMTWLLTPARPGTAAPLGEGGVALADPTVGVGVSMDVDADELSGDGIQPISAQDRAYFEALMRETWEPIHSSEEALALTRGRLRPDLVVDEVVTKRLRFRDLQSWLHAAGDSGYGPVDPVYLIGILGPDIRRGDMLMSSGIPSISGDSETPSERILRPLDGLFMAWHAESGDLVAGGALQDLPDPEAHLSLAGLRMIDELPEAAMPETQRSPRLDANDAEPSR